MKVLLAIEMSQRNGSVAVRSPDSRIDTEPIAPKKRHDDDFMPAIDRLFQRAGLKPADLDAVGVSLGPGGFTGLRIAVSAAKMLAESLGAQLVGVPSALVVAEATLVNRLRTPRDRAIITLASKHDSAWCTTVEHDGNAWSIQGEPGIRDARSMVLDEVAMVVADEHLPADIRDRCSTQGIEVITPIFDARACLAIAARWLEQGKTVDPLRLLPIYPREPEAVSLWEKRHARP